jgi:hypothetical protein
MPALLSLYTIISYRNTLDASRLAQPRTKISTQIKTSRQGLVHLLC